MYLDEMYKTIKKICFLIPVLCIAGVSEAQDSASIEIEPYKITDGNNINLMSGKISLGLPYVRIGSGQLMLSNTIYPENGSFENVYDDLEGIAFIHQRCRPGLLNSQFCDFEYVMTARVGGSATHFRLSADRSAPVQSQSFTPTNDVFAELTSSTDGKYLYLTKASETTFTFKYSTPKDEGYAEVFMLEKIEYSNGFTINIVDESSDGERYRSVTTNTGLQLKFVFENPDVNPFHAKVIAINNAYEYCDPAAEICDLKMDWPTATFEWPEGYPRGFDYTKDSVFRVTDWKGQVTEFYQQQIDIHINDGGYAGPPEYIPAIAAIKDAATKAGSVSAKYHPYTLPGGRDLRYAEVVKTAGGNWVYDIGISSLDSSMLEYVNTSIGPDGGLSVITSKSYGAPLKVRTPEGKTVWFAKNEVNRVKYVVYEKGNTIRYLYDDVGRLYMKQVYPRGSSVVYSNSLSPELHLDEQKAFITEVKFVDEAVCSEYPKACNKPSSITDPEGNVTEFKSYNHMGKPELIYRPANKKGIRPVTAYSYEEKYAYYKNAAGSYMPASAPVWLLTVEKTCQTGSYNPNSGCAKGDGTRTEYDYGPNTGPNNLWLRGIAVIDESSSEVRRTCYSYDMYGNRIGEYTPKAKLTRCP